MTSKRVFFAMMSILVLMVLLSLGGASKANQQLHKEGDKLVDLKLQKTVLDKQQNDLQKAKKDILEFEELESLTESIVPRDKDQARTIIEIANLAQQQGILLGQITFPNSDLGLLVKGKKTTTDNSTTQLTEVKDVKGVYSMEITIASHKDIPVAYEQLIGLLSGLERNRRTAQVVDISIIPDEDDKTKIHFKVILNAYIRP